MLPTRRQGSVCEDYIVNEMALGKLVVWREWNDLLPSDSWIQFDRLGVAAASDKT